MQLPDLHLVYQKEVLPYKRHAKSITFQMKVGISGADSTLSGYGWT